MDRLRIASEILKIAKVIVADDYKYIYDPDHKKHPGGGYQKTQKGWQKGKQEKKDEESNNKEKKPADKPNKSKENRKEIEQKINKLSPEKRQVMAKDAKAPQKLLDILSNYDDCKESVAMNKNTHPKTLDKLANDNDSNILEGVAGNRNTSPETLDKLAEDPDMLVVDNVVRNPNTSAETLDKLSKEKADYIRYGVAWHKNTSAKTLDKLSGDKNWDVRYGVVQHPNTSIETLKKLSNDQDESVRGKALFYLKKKQQQQNAAPAAPPAPPEPPKPPKSSGESKLPKYKFKGDDKTQAIIRKKFEKDEDEEETDTIYGEMAKFSRDDVAPMGVYHGRTKEQLKADFIKNMDPSNYASPESFKKAQDRIRKMSANDFSKILASIFADEEEEEI